MIGPIRYAWLSLATAISTLALKACAAYVTGSVGLLSDALESIVNVVAALFAVFVLRVAARPADDAHPHGYEKVEYFSSGFEGALILIAALAIMVEAVPRLFAPTALRSVDVGVGLSAVAGLMNFAVARALFHGAKRHHSIALEADAHHLMTDVWTSVGVLGAIVAAKLTGWHRIDPLVAIVVAANIMRTGGSLIGRSLRGLLDAALPEEELRLVNATLQAFVQREGAQFHALRTRQSGARRFIEVHVLVSGSWSVKRGHDLCEDVERELRKLAPRTTVMTHLEPIEDPQSFADQDLDRAEE